MKHCRQCGFEGEGNFCMMCGGLMEEPVETGPPRCPSCGEEIDPRARFCMMCGSGISEDGKPAAPPVTVPPPAPKPALVEPVSVVQEPSALVFCDICGGAKHSDSWTCKRCARKNLCPEHFKGDFDCCEICVKLVSQFDQVDREKKMKKVIPGKRYDEFLSGKVHLSLGWIPPGHFSMGSERGRYNEKPVHLIKITKGFWMSKNQITQEQWEAIIGNNPSSFKGPDHPVEYVSWQDCQDFCRRLSDKIGKKCRLPTEAEWEYACRAGTETEYCFGDKLEDLSHYAWFALNSVSTTHPVGKLKSNNWGMYGMHGNVQEWCQDWYNESYYRDSPVKDPEGPNSGYNRVVRGGSWLRKPDFCRSAHRDGDTPNTACNYIGFRIVVEQPE